MELTRFPLDVATLTALSFGGQSDVILMRTSSLGQLLASSIPLGLGLHGLGLPGNLVLGRNNNKRYKENRQQSDQDDEYLSENMHVEASLRSGVAVAVIFRAHSAHRGLLAMVTTTRKESIKSAF